MSAEFAIVDLFAGPGGLAEGFSSIRNKNGARPFRIALSVEKEASAFETLRLRSFFRQFDDAPPAEYYHFLNGEIPEPDWGSLFPAEWKYACLETAQLELGSRSAANEIDARLAAIVKSHGRNIILIGGPPCQAYSLVGRARNKGVVGYEASNDHRHFLCKEYIRILRKLKPAAFVMENVKGLLSSSVDGELVFDQVIDDLRRVGGGSYRLVPLAPRSGQSFFEQMIPPPALDFVVRAEDHGVPQNRHRVIIVGIRADIAAALDDNQMGAALLPKFKMPVLVRDVLKGMPKLRSGLSGRDDDEQIWRSETSRVMRSVSKVIAELPDEEEKEFRDLGERVAREQSSAKPLPRMGGSYAPVPASCPKDLKQWLVDENLRRFPNNETRGHMLADLGRYFFAALYGRVVGASPKAKDFPDELSPDHRNWKTGKFADRFRVQLWNSPATTVTSHISKDGHYFIHPDPAQCRSLTVREAARLQTFPDNYFFGIWRTRQWRMQTKPSSDLSRGDKSACARTSDFLQRLQGDLPRPVSPEKIFLFAIPPNHPYNSAHPVPLRGAYRDRHGRWVRDAVDAAASGARGVAGRISVSDRPARRRPALKRLRQDLDRQHMSRSKRFGGGSCGRQRRVVLAPVAGVKLTEIQRTQPGVGESPIRQRRWQEEFVAGESAL